MGDENPPARPVTSDERIKVLYVSPVGERGGAETLLLDILKFHDRRLFDPLVCFLRPGPLVDQVARLGVPIAVVETSRIRHVRQTLKTVGEIRRLIKTENVRIVFGNSESGHVFGGLAAIGTGAKAVWFQHGLTSAGSPLAWLAAAIPANRIYVNSRTTAGAQARIPNCRSRIELMYCGVDTSRYVPLPASGRPRLSALGISPAQPVVAMFARFQEWKGQDVLLDAAIEVAASCQDARFLLVGDTSFGLEPQFKSRLKQLASTPDLAGRVVFAGFRNDVPELLNEVDIVVHSHRAPEPFGLSIAEAMLMEKPVITSRLGGPAEFITDDSGVLVPPDDAQALAHGILDLLHDAPRRRALGRNGRAVVLGRFSMDRMIAELEASYRQVLSTWIH